MEAQVQVRVRDSVGTVFCDADVELLEAIAREGTLADGATSLGLSYRSAWGKLRKAEACLGTKLIETTVGGSGGGSTRLTTAAIELVERYGRFRSHLSAYAAQEFRQCFEINGTESGKSDVDE
jgi:molybdate transport system regulatory protein